MKAAQPILPEPSAPDFLTGGGEMERLIRAFDWSTTPLGPLSSWPQNLRTCVRIMLTSRQPFWLGWGKDLIKIYNDPYKAILGGKHPAALGQPAARVWKDIWKDIDPLLQQVMEKDQGIYAESQLLIMERNGYPEETYYTFSYTPIPGEDGRTAGMICANTDDTEKIISERQLRTLTELGNASAEAGTTREAYAIARNVFRKNPADFSFTFFYELLPEQRASLTDKAGARPPGLPAEVDLREKNLFASTLAKAAETRESQLLPEPEKLFGPLPRGAWPISSANALVLPVFQKGHDLVYGFLLTGLNPYQLPNARYQSFLSLSIDLVSSTVSRIQHLEQEKKRLEAMAEMAKTRYAAETNLRQLVTQAPVAMAVFKGPQYVVDIANEAAFAIWQKPVADTIGRPLLEVLPELVEQGFEAILESVYLRGETFLGHERPIMLIRNGHPDMMYFNFSFKPLLDEFSHIVGVIDIAVDVTSHVVARKAIEDNEKLFRTLTESIPQLIWMTDDKGNQVYVSGRWQEYTGIHPRDESSWGTMLHEDDRKPIAEVWRRSLNTGSEYRIEVRLKSKTGEYRWHLGQGSPIYNTEGKIIRWIGSFMDIQDQKTFSDRLERLVFNRTSELQRSNEELEQFAHVASHDLREPLRKIRTFASLLAEEFEKQMSDKAKTYLEKMDSAAIRMNTMIQGILRYSSFQPTQENDVPVNLNEVIRKIETDLEILMAQKKATLVVGKLPVLMADFFRIYQLFYNLIVNSLKFSPPHKPPVIDIAEKEIPHAEWAVLPRNILRPFVRIEVEDNGIGFDPEFNEKIFKSFTRLHAVDKYEGTGLGLALCKKIAMGYGGNIRANGTEGKGAVFTIDLPLRADEKPAS